MCLQIIRERQYINRRFAIIQKGNVIRQAILRTVFMAFGKSPRIFWSVELVKLNLSLWNMYSLPGLYFQDMENSLSHNLHLHQDVQLHEGVDQADCTLHWWPLFYLCTIMQLWPIDKTNQLDATSQLKCQYRTVEKWLFKIFPNKRIFFLIFIVQTY